MGQKSYLKGGLTPKMYQKWVKMKEAKKGQDLEVRELLMLRENRYVKVLLLTVPLVVMLLVSITLQQCLVLNVRKLYMYLTPRRRLLKIRPHRTSGGPTNW